MRKAASLLSAMALITGVSPALARQVEGRLKPSESLRLFLPAGRPEARLLETARRQASRHDDDQALAAYGDLIQRQPDFAKAITERAFLEEARGDLGAAKADYDRVLELTPTRANAWSHAAWIRALMKIEPEEASRRCDRALAIERSLDAMDSCGFVAFQRGDYSAASGLYEEALRLWPQSYSTLYMLGVTKVRLGREQDGQSDIAKALKRKPDLEALWSKRGVISRSVGSRPG